MMSSQMVYDIKQELKKEKENLKKSEEKEIEITNKFKESIKKLSFLL